MYSCQLSFLNAEMMELTFRRNKFCIRCIIDITRFCPWRGGVEQGKNNPTMASLNCDHNREDVCTDASQYHICTQATAFTNGAVN